MLYCFHVDCVDEIWQRNGSLEIDEDNDFTFIVNSLQYFFQLLYFPMMLHRSKDITRFLLKMGAGEKCKNYIVVSNGPRNGSGKLIFFMQNSRGLVE